MTNVQLDAEDRLLFAATIERLALLSNGIEQCRSGELECSAQNWSTYAEHGLLGLGISPEFGGIGGGARDLALVMHHIGRNLLQFPFLDTVVLGATLVARLGSEDQKREILPAIVEGGLRLSFAHREGCAGDLVDFVEAQARGERITGSKLQALDGAMADQFVVSARDKTGALRFYLVERHQPGVACQHYRLADNRMATRLVLENALAKPLGGDASPHIGPVFSLAAACLAAESVGAIESVSRETLEYAKLRKQFGQPIGSFQVIQHKLVDMFIAEETASAMVTDALEALDADLADSGLIVSAAKAQADRSGRFIAENAIQIHGGIGMTDECSVGHYLKRLITNASMFGTPGWHVSAIAKSVAG